MSRRHRHRRKKAPPRPAVPGGVGTGDEVGAPVTRPGRATPATPEGDARGCLAIGLSLAIVPIVLAMLGAGAVRILGGAVSVLSIFLVVVAAVAIALFSFCATSL